MPLCSMQFGVSKKVGVGVGELGVYTSHGRSNGFLSAKPLSAVKRVNREHLRKPSILTVGKDSQESFAYSWKVQHFVGLAIQIS